MSGKTSREEEGMNSDEHQNTAQSSLKKFVCDVCNKSFKYKTDLIRHKRIHTGEKPYKCDHCGSSFAHKSNLTTHLRKHSNERPYACTHCGYAFMQKAHLTKHVKAKTGRGPYQCPVCGMPFEAKCVLSQHKFSHDEDKPPKCTQCEKSFSSKSALNLHLLIHTGEKPFKCDYCGRSFNRKATLKRHEKNVHKKEKKYQCIHCKRKFSALNRFERHKQVHTSLRVFSANQPKIVNFPTSDEIRDTSVQEKKKARTCNTCGLTFLFTSGLKRHFSSHLRTKHLYFGYGQKVLKYLRVQRHHSQKHRGSLRKLRLSWRVFNWTSEPITRTTKAYFKCIMCSEKFYRPSNFLTHMYGHNDDELLKYSVNSCIFMEKPITNLK